MNVHSISRWARMTKLKNTLQVWSQRGLTLKGKVTILNSLALSALIYVTSVIDTPDIVIKEVDNIITEFLWKGKLHKIAKNIIIQGIGDGSLKFPNFQSKVKSLKLSWVKRLIFKSKANWKLIPMYIYQHCDLEFFFACKRNILKNENMLKFYKDIYIYNEWFMLHSTEPVIANDVKSEIFWNNRCITIDRSPLNHGEWYRNGIVYVKDLLDKTGIFYSHSKIGELYIMLNVAF